MASDDLSERLREAGAVLLKITDDLAMQAQGAMWVFDHSLGDWRYYLVTSLVDSLGRRRAYRILVDAFEKTALPKEMTIEDVHLGSPRDPFFQLVSELIRVDSGGRAEFRDCSFNDVPFDGVIYRSVRNIPSEKEAMAIEKRFSREIKELERRIKQGGLTRTVSEIV